MAGTPTPVPRRRMPGVPTPASYFASGNGKEHIHFFSSGCALMDQALGGGYPLGRCSNIVGDKSSGKTLKAMEAAANFALTFPDGWIRYAEAEAAFDQPYAEALGIPIDRITFNEQGKPIDTVEDLYDDLVRMLDENKKRPGLYIIDSLDALSDDEEMKADFDKGSYGGKKPKAIGKLFRMLIDRMNAQQVHFMVISQIRDKLNVTFGETKTRSGGRALDFYATHIVWLAELEKLKKTIKGVERVIGIKVEAYVKKNKVGLSFRRARYPILYGYGIDDMTSSVEWLIEVGRGADLVPLGLTKEGYKIRLPTVRNKGGAEANEMRAALGKLVATAWAEIETTFLPLSKKY